MEVTLRVVTIASFWGESSQKLTVAVVAHATVRGPGGSPDITRRTPLEFHLLPLHCHRHVVGGGPQIAPGGAVRICSHKKDKRILLELVPLGIGSN